MTCRRAHRLLAAYRRDDWSPRDRAALGQHLSTCSACRKIEFAYRSVGESVRQLPSITPPPGSARQSSPRFAPMSSVWGVPSPR